MGQKIAALLLLAVGLALLGFVAVSLARDLSIWVLGRTVSGRVVEQWVERVGDRDEGELNFRYLVRYEFQTAQGQTMLKTATVSVEEWSALEPGTRLRVTYFPLYPSHARLYEQQYIPVFLCAYLPFVIVGWLALQAGWRLARPPSSG